MRVPPKAAGAALLVLAYYVIICNCHCLSASKDDDNTEPASSDLFHVTKFSLNLFKKLVTKDPKTNLFLSPYSVWNALALAYLGAEGETALELKEVLGITDKVSTLKTWRSLNYLYKIRQFSSHGYYFGLVNKIYLDSSMPIRPCIKNILDYTDLESINFKKSNQSSGIINGFVRAMTNDNIDSVVEPRDLEGVESVLVNAAFFSDKWKKPFKKQQTKLSSFYPLEGEPKKMQMMSNRGYFNHGVSETLRSHIVELPYTLSDISMFVFLPPSIERRTSFNQLLDNLNPDSFLEAVDNLAIDELDIAIPKLSIGQEFNENLKEALIASGINHLFDSQGANLTALVPDRKVFMSGLVHRASLKLSEEGTQASSRGPASFSGRFARPQNLKNFVCDHPFVYVIYDKLTRNILFMGAFKG